MSYAEIRDELDHTRTYDLTCPYCGYEDPDGWELPDEGHHDCDDCGETFYFRRELNPQYTTKRKGHE